MRANSGVLMAIILVMQAIIVPATADAVYAMGGTSSTAKAGGGQISGSLAQIEYIDSVIGQKDLVARIWSEVRVPAGQTGSASVEWVVPKSSSTTMTQSSLTASAYGTSEAYVEKTSKSGTAYALGYIMSSARTISGLPSGSSEISSEAYMTGTGSAFASANGSASFSASASGYKVSGMVKGVSEMNVENTYGGKVSGVAALTDPALALLWSSSSVDSSGSVQSDVGGWITLASKRGAVDSGESRASASVSGTGTADSEVASPETIIHAGLTGVDMSAEVSVHDIMDRAEAGVVIDPAAGLISVPEWIYASNLIGLSSSVSRTSSCCPGGEMALAAASLADAEWDASASRDASGDNWEVCISGATGLTRDGSDIATEPGFATGATTVNRNSWVGSEIMSLQRADADSFGPSTSSATTLILEGPPFSSAGSVQDASGARFAIDFEEMTAYNGDVVFINGEDVLHTDIAGPDAFLWITGDNPQVINGHYADDGLSIYDVVFEPQSLGEVAGPEIIVAGSRDLYLHYETGQPFINP